MITKFKNFNESVGDYNDKPVGVQVNVDKTKLLYDADGGFIDLGREVSETEINNMKKRHPGSEIIVRDGHKLLYVKKTNESKSDFEYNLILLKDRFENVFKQINIVSSIEEVEFLYDGIGAIKNLIEESKFENSENEEDID